MTTTTTARLIRRAYRDLEAARDAFYREAVCKDEPTGDDAACVIRINRALSQLTPVFNREGGSK